MSINFTNYNLSENCVNNILTWYKSHKTTEDNLINEINGLFRAAKNHIPTIENYIETAVAKNYRSLVPMYPLTPAHTSDRAFHPTAPTRPAPVADGMFDDVSISLEQWLSPRSNEDYYSYVNRLVSWKAKHGLSLNWIRSIVIGHGVDFDRYKEPEVEVIY